MRAILVRLVRGLRLERDYLLNSEHTLTIQMTPWEIAKKLSDSYHALGAAKTVEIYKVTRRKVTDSVKWADSCKKYPEAHLERCTSWTNANAEIKKWVLSIECINLPSEGTENLIHGDFFSNTIDSDYAHIIECDPPYGVDFDKKLNRDFVNRNYVEVRHKDYEEFIYRMVEECYRIGKENSWLILWHSDKHYALIRDALESVGYKVGYTRGIWYKTRSGKSALQNPYVQLGYAHEQFIYARKGSPLINRMGRTDVFDYPTVPYERVWRHPAERPIELIEDILTTFAREGSAVVCPFAGSGNTLLAARRAKMSCVGFELVFDYVNIYKSRYADEVACEKSREEC